MDAAELKTAVEKAVEPVMTGFEEFKKTNDERIKQIETKGVADPVTTEKLGKIEKTLAAFEPLNQAITLTQGQLKAIEEQNKTASAWMKEIETKLNRAGIKFDNTDPADPKHVQYKAVFNRWARLQKESLPADADAKALNEYKSLFGGNDTLGGYYLAPSELEREIIKAVILMSPLRALARVTTISVPSLRLPKRTGVFAAKRVSEIGLRSETTGYKTGMVDIPAGELFAEVHISQQMIEDSAFDIEAEMQGEFVEQFAVAEGKEFISGIGGAEQAEGVLTNGDVLVVNSGLATDFQADALINVFFGTPSAKGLKTSYAANATWIFNRQTLGKIRQLKDATGQYLWLPGIAAGQVNTVLGAPYAEMPDMPDVAAGTYPVAVGDFRRAYRVVDRVSIQVLRDPFTVAANGMILFRARKRVGGGVTLGEAIVKMKIST